MITDINNTTSGTSDEVSIPVIAWVYDQIDNNADLVTVKTVDNATPQEGDTVTFTIEVINNGYRIATNVELNDTLPAGLTFTGSSASHGSYVTPIWSIGTLNDGEIAEINITAVVD